MYVRMSSLPQDFSIQHQIEKLSAYAEENGIEIVMVYADAGKSGLCINGRDGLQGLITDVQSGSAGFDAVLVYDVSRWGRFQNIDESAYYEFICRQAGVQVIYCAEHFIDDGSPMYSLMKGMKRIMAAEYSRELGDKVHLAQSRFVRMGYKQGGRAGFALLRQPVSQRGELKPPLNPGERKSVATDRVALTHSSLSDVQIVQQIFRLYAEDGWTDTEIARELNSKGHLNSAGERWTASNVRRILINPRYCGELVYNQTSRRLRSKVQSNPEHLWVRCEGALTPMVSRKTFDLAQAVRMRRADGPDRDSVLAELRRVFEKHGTISAKICNASDLPKKNIMYKLFGTYVNAYAAAGLPIQHTAKGALDLFTLRILIDALLAQVIEFAKRAGATVSRTKVWNVLLLNDCLTVKVSISSRRRCEDGCRRWRVPLTCGAKADFVICGLMDDSNVEVEKFLLLRTAASEKDSLLLSRKKLERYSKCTFNALEELFGL